LKENKSRV